MPNPGEKRFPPFPTRTMHKTTICRTRRNSGDGLGLGNVSRRLKLDPVVGDDFDMEVATVCPLVFLKFRSGKEEFPRGSMPERRRACSSLQDYKTHSRFVLVLLHLIPEIQDANLVQ